MSAPEGTAEMSSAAESLDRWRRQASKMSDGASSNSIYAAFEEKVRLLCGTGDLLDFGAGTGHLIRRLFRSGQFRTVTGADLYPRSADLPAEIGWIEGDLNNQLPAPAAAFDTIVAAEVIEHLENPRAVAREFFRLLRPGGLLVFSTPNNESVRSLIALAVRGHFVAFGDSSYPAHITALTGTDLRRILTESGFGRIDVSYTDTGSIPGLPSRSWQSILGKRARGVRFSDNLVVAARKPDGAT
ncbi:MAG TPA: methyltransferase domain-containing protein [Polyangia bacterium]|nr:methyltransferase domain-containing protein [Polyangia bacterium]